MAALPPVHCSVAATPTPACGARRCCPGGDVAFHCAGPHYDPEGREHPNHAGDLPVLLSSGGRALSLVYTGRFQPGQVLGRSVVLHALPDDYRSQPTGAAGGRIACGVISPVA